MKGWAFVMLVSGGLFIGGVTVLAWERIPVWRALPLAEFRRDFAVAIRKADRVQPALLLASIAGTVGFVVSATGAARTLALFGAVGFIGTLIASAALLVPLQRRIVASSQREESADEAMRRRWFRGHLGRSVLGGASYLLVASATIL